MRSVLLAVVITAVPCCAVGQSIASPVALPEAPERASFEASSAPISYGASIAISPVLAPVAAFDVGTGQAQADQDAGPPLNYVGSPYVPLDDWTYPVFDRLEALGYIPDSTAMIRPWTRMEAARYVEEARSRFLDMDDEEQIMLASLAREFRPETRRMAGARDSSAKVESVYTRFTGIGGTPLRDGFHFSQTLVDDFGRPYGAGANEIDGFAARGHAGPFSIYFRGEYQYAPQTSLSPYSPSAQQALAADDNLPFGWNLRLGNTNRLRPIEAYAAVNVHNWQVSVGQQSLWWGPDRSTSLILSNNAAPMPMVRINRVAPAYLPGFLRMIGPIHLDLFMARQGGIHYVRLGPNFVPYGTGNKALTPAPYLWGVHLTIKPTPNLELGLAHTVLFTGYGRPFTFGTFLHTFSTLGNGQAVDPGKRVTELNLRYHVPFYRRAIQVYAEGMAWDDPIEGKFIARFAWDPGVYISELPRLHRFDARFEAVYTNLPKDYYVGYFYSNPHYAQGYTNYGQILGSWVGRQGVGGQASTTHWFSPQAKATFFFRKMVATEALLEGGSNSDVGVSGSLRLRPQVEVNGLAQYESWKFPLLGNASRSNFTGSFEIRFYPLRELAGKGSK